MRRTLLFLAAWAFSGGGPVAAQQWFDQVLPPAERAHDFGTVARGSKVRHAFRLVNTTSYDIHIATWRPKCGCTDVKVGARDIPPGTQTTIEATLDTTKFQGYKASGLILVLDRPSFVEIDLNLTTFIRNDIMLNPGQVDFGTVRRGSKPTVPLNLGYYGGRPEWDIPKIHTISPNLTAKLTRVQVGTPGATAQYQLTATLDEKTPPGYFKDEITLLTNDKTAPSIPISVTANVQSTVAVAPGILSLGRLKPGQVIRRPVLVKASQPFKVTSATSQKPDLKATGTFGDAKPFHTLTVELTAPTQPGPFNAVLEIATDVQDEPPAKLTTFATVVP